MKIKNLVQKEVRNLSSYEVKTILEKKTDKRIIKMNLNENFAISKDAINNLLMETCKSIDVRSYPPPRGIMAVEAIANFVGFDESEISVANGADELMDLLMKVFIRNQSKVIIVEPSFPMYTFFTELYGGKKVTIMLKRDFSLNIDSILKRADKETKLLFICSPNNPTGNQFKDSEIKTLLEEFKGIVVVDEAYGDFASNSIIKYVRDYDNLVLLRSFSKAFGLAGLRLGYLVSSKHIVKYVQRVMGPFNVNSVTQQTIVSALKNWNFFKNQIDIVINERIWLMDNLKQIDGIDPYPSDANFILFKVSRDKLNSNALTERLEKRKVLVKDRGHLQLLENCIRVTIGSRKMNQAFLSALKASLEE
ncbi:histidinol-phosphate transaminase [Candidatus Bathyarchaeota archaeon]|nr:histidinol-phosphate transaminase [Candidatus Bathyarchaeota archaeon]